MQIPVNLTADRLCPTLQASAFAKARVEYFLGQGRVWSYPAVMVIRNDTESKHLEALIRKHWRDLIKGHGGVWLDAYNNSINKSICGSILTNLDKSNLYFITERTK